MLASGLPFTLTSCLLSTTVTPTGRRAHVAAVALAGVALLTLITASGGPGLVRRRARWPRWCVPSSPVSATGSEGGQGQGRGRRWLLRKHRSPAFSCRPCEPPAFRDHKEPPHIFTPQGWLVKGAWHTRSLTHSRLYVHRKICIFGDVNLSSNITLA